MRAGEGTLVEAHERFEDEVVFPLIRSVLPADPPRPRGEPLPTDLREPRRVVRRHRHRMAHGVALRARPARGAETLLVTAGLTGEPPSFEVPIELV